MNKKIKIFINYIKSIINIKKIKKKYKIINNIIIKKFIKNFNIKKYIKINKKKSKLKKIINIYKKIFIIYKDYKLFYKLSLKENILIKKNDYKLYYNNIKKLINKFKKIIFNKKLVLNAIIQIYTGTGGNDCEDWVKILFNMYKLWAIKNNYKINIINKIYFKNPIIEILGKYAYGNLLSENGIHKLIRISPFNKKRHTSIAYVHIYPLLKNNNKIKIKKNDLVYKTFRSSGTGGQNVNKVETGVRLIYKPKNLSVICTKTRYQILNKKYALKILKSKLEFIEKNKKNKKKLNEYNNYTRIYIMHPYKMIKDYKTGYKTKKINYIINGNINKIINKYIKLYLI
ncbi:MAG: PCRF domain-containing protein [Candidatus Shikimatogenerans sp. JK-2022]|nr:PCRF domain-containing protein [Candidatus Shikimatogenerans bostrichidophilus]